MDVDDWLKIIDHKLQISQCVVHEKVLYASHQLTGAAVDWWTSYTVAHADPENITWEEFKVAFRNQHVPPGQIKLRRIEFMDLKQESMTVQEYLTCWTQLSRYCTYDVDTDGKKQDCFKQGLNPELHCALSNVDYASFQKLVDKAFIMEREHKNLVGDCKRRMADQGSSSNARPRRNPP